MNTDEKILQALRALQDDMTGVKSDITAVKGETAKISGIEQRFEEQGNDITALKSGQEQQGKFLGAIGDNVSTLLSDHSAQRQDISSLLTDLGTLHEEFHTSHEEVTGEIRAARAEAKMDNIDLKSTVAKKIQSHERRITNIEEHEGIENPEKH